MIIAKNLFKSYSIGKQKNIKAINDTSLELPNAGFICICGESGSGKTTLLNVLGGLEDFKQGSIYYGDDLLHTYNRKVYEEKRIDNFGYVFQNNLLVEDYTVEENIDIALEMFGLSEEERHERIFQSLQTVNMNQYKDKIVSELSGGEKQRVVIARVLAKSPQIIYADEPTANLDRKNAVMVMETLRIVAENSLVIMVSHQKELACCYADRILTIQNGVIVEDCDNIPTGIQNIDLDGSIYLEDYKEEFCDLGGLDVHIYGDPVESSRLDIICVNGKYYLRMSENSEGVLVDDQSDILIMNERTKSEIKNKQMFCLEKNNVKRVNGFKVINRLSNALKAHMGKKKFVMEILFIVNALLLSFLATTYFTVVNPPKSKIVKTDSHYISVSIVRQNIESNAQQSDIYHQIIGSVKGEKKVHIDNKSPVTGDEIYTKSNLVFYGKKASQLEKVHSMFSDFSYAIAEERLSEENMILGRLPANSGEIVLDKWIADRIIHSEDLVLKSYKEYSDFIGETIRIDGNSVYPVMIVGICETNEPNVYIDLMESFTIAEWLQDTDYKDSTVNIYLNRIKDEDIRRDTIEKEYDQIMEAVSAHAFHFIIDTENPVEAKAELEKVAKNIYDQYKVKVKISYMQEAEIKEFKARYESYVKMLTLISLIVVVLTIVSVFYLIFVDISAQKRLLTVYYVNGVKGSYLIFAYSLLLIKLLTVTVLPTVLLYRLLVWQINALTILNMILYFPSYAIVLMIIMYFVLAGLMSFSLVSQFIRKPVARQGIIE